MSQLNQHSIAYTQLVKSLSHKPHVRYGNYGVVPSMSLTKYYVCYVH